MRKLFVLTMLIFLLAPLSRAEELALTLDEAIAIGLRESRDILFKEEEVRKAKAKIKESEAGFFPDLDLSFTSSQTRGYYAKDISQANSQATLKQYLYQGGKVVNTIRYNNYNLEVSKTLLDKTKLDIIADIKKTFFTLMLADDLSRLNQGILKNTEEHLASLKERYQSGEVSQSEILEIEASLENARKAYSNSLTQRESSQNLLNQLLYLADGTVIKPEGKFTYEPLDMAYDQAFLSALKNRPEIKQYEEQLKADRASVDINKALKRPSVYASWDYYGRSHMATATGLNRNNNDYNVIGVTFSWPVFDGWETKAKIEQSLIDLKKTQILKDKAIKDVATELKNAYLGLKDAIVKISASEYDMKVYQNNLSVTQDRYNDGILSLLDLDDANLKYEIALFNKRQAIYDYLIAKINFERATGGF